MGVGRIRVHYFIIRHDGGMLSLSPRTFEKDNRRIRGRGFTSRAMVGYIMNLEQE